ncbi:AEC family transporter [uncultured Thiothrix sp.]|uniref:AEC family transporter n=1 Tax=uncultured Thiothrix sp. TaxID=223185 RepID=UPI002635B4B2|nr:AEC family transporter [uncultured Thiothrix sp.]HMT92866.1 AEC family transporter [Thiolinea sp.]
MLNILLTISPVFILIGLGYFAFKQGLIKAEAMSSLGNIVLYCAIPAVMIGGLSKIHISEIVEPYFLLAYGIGSLLNLLFAIFLTLKLQRNLLTKSAIQSLGMSIPNSMFVGFPVLSLSLELPDVASLSLMMAVLVENILILPIILILLEYSVGYKGDSANILRTVALRIVKNPLIIAIAVGVVLSLLGVTLPKPISQSLDLLTKISAGLALLFIGAALANIKPQEQKPWADISLVMLGKLILHPALVALWVFLLPSFNSSFQQAVIIMAAAPMMSIYPILGERYGLRDFCASTLFMTTLVSFISIAVVLLLLES